MIANKIPSYSSSSTLSKPFITGWLILLIITGAFIRVHLANSFYYSADEAMHTNIARADTLGQVLQFSRYEIHPPLSYVLEHYWMKISDNPAFARCLPLLFGLMLIPLYYRIGSVLGGELAGIACATLITFSHGCIIQSYVVRQYIFFLFFISLAFYCYLLWRNNRNLKSLLGYTVCGMLAALCHFSAIFPIACITVFEMVQMRNHSVAKGTRWQWLGANAMIAGVAISVYYMWQPLFVPLASYFTRATIPLLQSIFFSPLYPLSISDYLFPRQSYLLTFIILLVLIIYSSRKYAHTADMIRLQSFITLAGYAFIMATLLFVTHIYPALGGRHTIWILPLLIPPVGWILAMGTEKLLCIVPSPALRKPIAALCLFTAGCLLYSPQERFKDGSEYVWHKEVWEDFSHYMSMLGPHDLIVTEKDDGIMLANLYRSIGEDAFTGKAMAKLAPYRNTHILFNPYYPRNYSTDVLLATLREAQEKHFFDGIDKLVFLRMAWSRSPLTDLMLCDALPKQIITFPAFLSAPPLTRDNILRSRAALMIVSKENIMKYVLSPTGEAHNCLDKKHDMVPGFIPSSHSS